MSGKDWLNSKVTNLKENFVENSLENSFIVKKNCWKNWVQKLCVKIVWKNMWNIIWKIWWDNCTFYIVHCTLYIVQCTVYIVQCSVQCKVKSCSSVFGGSPSVPQFGEWNLWPGSCFASPIMRIPEQLSATLKWVKFGCRGPQNEMKFVCRGPENGVKFHS